MMIDKETQTKILAVLESSPSAEYLFNHCKTNEQIYQWFQTRFCCLDLYKSFEQYFSGKAETFYYEIEDKNDREFYALLRDFYLKFYTLVQFNWKLLEHRFTEKGYDLQKLPKTPGEALIRVISETSDACFTPCILPYYKWTPSQQRDLRKSDKELREYEDTGLSNDKVYERKLKNYEKDLKQTLRPIAPQLWFLDTCLYFCSKAKNQAAKRYYQEFMNVSAELDLRIHSYFHPSKKVLGFEWLKGEKRYSSPYGGVTINKTSQ